MFWYFCAWELEIIRNANGFLKKLCLLAKIMRFHWFLWQKPCFCRKYRVLMVDLIDFIDFSCNSLFVGEFSFNFMVFSQISLAFLGFPRPSSAFLGFPRLSSAILGFPRLSSAFLHTRSSVWADFWSILHVFPWRSRFRAQIREISRIFTVFHRFVQIFSNTSKKLKKKRRLWQT